VADLDVHLPAIAAGDPDAFARWVAGAEPRIRASLWTFAARVDTEAVVQETLLRMWQVAPRVRKDGPDCLVRLAVRSARNLAISELRRARVRPAEVEELERRSGGVNPVEPDPMLRQLIQGCLDKLPRKPGAAIRARLTASGSRPDPVLCAEVGMTLNTFLQNVRRARLSVAECLKRGGARLPETP
jgi:DNA-directed RNA polymerase specialized sigma24 family protein